MRVTRATVFLLALSLVSACARPTPPLVATSSPPAAQVVPQATASATRPAATVTRASPETSGQRNTPRPKPTAASTAAPSPAPSPVIIAEWFRESRDCSSSPTCVSYAFEIENPGATPLIADYRLHLRVLNDAPLSRDYQTRRDAEELITEWDWVPLTPARGRTAVAGIKDLPEAVLGVQAVTIEIVLSDRSTVLEAPFPPAKSVWLFETEKGYAATAILANPWQGTLTDIKMIALAFDDAGEVVGWASDFTEFVNTGEQGVRFEFDVATAPAAIRIYGGAEPAAYSVGLLYRWDNPEPDPEVTGVGFVQQDRELTYVFALENFGAEDMNTQYAVTAYDSLGRVIDVTHYCELNYLPYGVRYGVVDQMDLATVEVPVARIGVQVRRFGRMGLVPPVPQFDDIRYAAKGGNAGEVVAEVTNPDPVLPIEEFIGVAITYDSQGEINGGGSLVLPDLEPGAGASVRIPVIAAGAVATVEVLPKVMEEILFKPDEAKIRPSEGGG